MFEQFSAGYYLGRLYVQPHGGSRALLRAAHHRTVRSQLYGTADATDADADADAPANATAADAPLVMRYRQQHFVVDGADDLPERTLVVPRDWLEGYHDSEEPREVFLAKPDRAEQLLQFATPTDAGENAGRGEGHGGDDGGEGDTGRGSPFTPGSLSEVARPGFRPQ